MGKSRIRVLSEWRQQQRFLTVSSMFSLLLLCSEAQFPDFQHTPGLLFDFSTINNFYVFGVSLFPRFLLIRLSYNCGYSELSISFLLWRMAFWF